MSWRPVPIVPSRDAAVTREFWERLGFDVVDASPDDEPYLIAVRDGAELHFRHSPDHDESRSDASLYIEVDDVDVVHDEWRPLIDATGTPRLGTPTVMPWGLRELVLVDPNGTLVRIASPGSS